MLASRLAFVVKEIREGTIKVGRDNYVVVNVALYNRVKILVCILEEYKDRLKVGSYYYTNKAYVTHVYKLNNQTNNFTFRIDFIDDSTKEVWLTPEKSYVRLNVRIHKTKNNQMKLLGPSYTPTYNIRGSVKKEDYSIFQLLLVAFNSKAKEMDNLPDLCYVDIVGHILKNKIDGMSNAILVKEVVIRKEVDDDEKFNRNR